LATGSTPLIPKLPGVDNAVLAEDVFTGKATTGSSSVIIGGGLVGCEIALKLTDEGKQVTIVECLPQLAMGEPRPNRIALLTLLTKAGVTSSLCMPVVEILKDGVEIVDSMGRRSTIKAHTIILAVGRRKKVDETLLKAANEVAKEIYIIGDSKMPRKIIDAMKEGFWVAVNL
jgi:pyruvate/2-oxoglutarate dehydrogenase complex dihydrolipoamide dehydrogenase (E3) component